MIFVSIHCLIIDGCFFVLASGGTVGAHRIFHVLSVLLILGIISIYKLFKQKANIYIYIHMYKHSIYNIYIYLNVGYLLHIQEIYILFYGLYSICIYTYTLPKTNIAPKNRGFQ